MCDVRRQEVHFFVFFGGGASSVFEEDTGAIKGEAEQLKLCAVGGQLAHRQCQRLLLLLIFTLLCFNIIIVIYKQSTTTTCTGEVSMPFMESRNTIRIG